MVLAQIGPEAIERLAIEGWAAARAAAVKGGSPESLAPASRIVIALDGASTSVWRTHARYARALVEAAIAAAQDERDVMAVHLAHAHDLSNQLTTSKYPAIWPLPIDEAEGELWFEVDRYEDALKAYTRATAGKPGSAAWLGLARTADRLNNKPLACGAYRQWLAGGERKRDTAEFVEATTYLAGCQ